MKAIVAFAFLSTATSALAQQTIGSDALPITSEMTGKPATCEDFKKNGDGTWSNIWPIKIGGSNAAGPVLFRKGTPLNGLDVADQLERVCGKMQPEK